MILQSLVREMTVQNLQDSDDVYVDLVTVTALRTKLETGYIC